MSSCTLDAIKRRISVLGIVIPAAPMPVANYMPFTFLGNAVHLSGQISKKSDGTLIKGKIDGENIGDAKEAAKVAIINFIAQLNNATNNDLSRVKKIIKINVFISCTADFTDQPLVANAASDILVGVFGEEVGRHARAAVGVQQLPLGVAVEIDGVVELKSPPSSL